MQEITSRSPSLARPSSTRHPEQTGALDTGMRGWPAISAFASDHMFAVRRQMQIYASSFRSFLGRIRIQSPKGPWILSCGPSLERDQTGQYRRNARTHARAEGIKALWAKHPWADRPDLQMFLDGFDAGERYARSVDGRQGN